MHKHYVVNSIIKQVEEDAEYARENDLTWQAEMFTEYANNLRIEFDFDKKENKIDTFKQALKDLHLFRLHQKLRKQISFKDKGEIIAGFSSRETPRKIIVLFEMLGDENEGKEITYVSAPKPTMYFNAEAKSYVLAKIEEFASSEEIEETSPVFSISTDDKEWELSKEKLGDWSLVVAKEK